MDSVSITTDTITELLTRLINHSYGIFTVDNDGYIRSNNEFIMFTDQNKPPESHKFIVFKDNIKDPSSYILNPFSESLTLGTERTWFYELLLSHNECALPVIKVMRELIKFSLCSSLELTEEEQQQEIQKLTTSKRGRPKKNAEPVLMTPTTIKKESNKTYNFGYPLTETQKIELSSLMSEFSEKITSEILDQFNLITTNPSMFFKICYKDNNKRAYVSSVLFNATERANFRSVRPKTWQIYQQLFLKIFEINDIEDLSVASSSVSYPRFESVFTLFTLIQKTLTKFLYILLPNETDQDQFLDNLQFFSESLKHLDVLKRLGGWLKCIPTSSVNKINSPVLTRTAAPISISPTSYAYYQKPIQKPAVYNYYNPQAIKGPDMLTNNMIAPMPKLM
jgi:hypothetical protein